MTFAPSMKDEKSSTLFSSRLLKWFDHSGRKDLPWQTERTPYRVWVSEIMLQQTQVSTVIPYFERFIKRFPHISSLAHASLDDVLHLWSGLGYYSRARNLHKAAQIVHLDYNGEFPRQIDEVLGLPGVGRSTAGAILALSRDERHPILDGNVKRVLCRYHAIEGHPGQSAIEKKLWKIAEEYTPCKRIADYTQAIMDLGATVCRRSKPRCGSCPFKGGCLAHSRGEETDYPQSKTGKEIPIRKALFLMIRGEEGHILLEKRPPSGIWGGLWSLPQISYEESIESWCLNEGFQILEKERLPSFRHTFSHFHLQINPVKIKVLKTPVSLVMEKENLQWHSQENLSRLGLPSPVSKLLSKG